MCFPQLGFNNSSIIQPKGTNGILYQLVQGFSNSISCYSATPLFYTLHVYLLYNKNSKNFCFPSRTSFPPLGGNVTPAENAWTQSGSQSMILPPGAAAPENLIEMQIFSPSWDLLNQTFRGGLSSLGNKPSRRFCCLRRDSTSF